MDQSLPERNLEAPLLMIPGPVPVAPSIMSALSEPTLGHRDPHFVHHFAATLQKVMDLVAARSGLPVVVAGSGTFAMEMALLNILPAGAPILILSQGVFGDRMHQIAETLELDATVLRAEWGNVIRPDELRDALRQRSYAAITLTHVDTSTGTMIDLASLAALIKAEQPDALIVVDGVCATGGVEERMDDWGLDVILTGSQKALGLPPGLALLVAGPRAQAARKALGRVRSYYGDWERWRPIMENPDGYFATPATNMVVALDQALTLMFEEGLDARYARHRALAQALRSGLAELGFESFPAADCQAPTLSVLRYPAGVEAGAFLREMYRQGVALADGIGKLAGQVCRIGHMGNIDITAVLQVVDTAERVLSGAEANGKARHAAQTAFDVLVEASPSTQV
jgi:aspartate aminotransferase-like enzyme